MFKKVVKIWLIFLLGFTLVVPFAFAQESPPPTMEELIQQIQTLRTEISEVKQAANEAREIAVDSRLEAKKFKEETLYRLGLWRERLGKGMIMSVSAQGAARKAEKLVKTAKGQVKMALSRVQGMEAKFDTLSEKLSEETQARTNLQQNVSTLTKNVDGLKTDVSLAKQMAATAKAQAGKGIKKFNILSENLSQETRAREELQGNLDALSKEVDGLKTDVSLAKQMAATAKAQAGKAVKKLEKKVDVLGQEVDGLKTDVSLAKQMAATAKAQADQARKEVRGLRGEVKENRELFLSRLEKVLGEMKKREEKFKTKKVQIKAPSEKMIYEVKKGDSLWRIAGHPDIYNDSAKWRKIFEANKERLISPDSLYPGQKLIIPQE